MLLPTTEAPRHTAQAARSGGAVELSDTPGGGLTVGLSLPAAPRRRSERADAGAAAGSGA